MCNILNNKAINQGWISPIQYADGYATISACTSTLHKPLHTLIKVSTVYTHKYLLLGNSMFTLHTNKVKLRQLLLSASMQPSFSSTRIGLGLRFGVGTD